MQTHLTERLFDSMFGGAPGCRFRQDSWGCGNREIDPEPRGDGGVSDKTGSEGRGRQLGTRIGTVWTLSPALDQAKKKMCAGTPERVYSSRLLAAKMEIPVITSNIRPARANVGINLE
jgi:hypothetical protein